MKELIKLDALVSMRDMKLRARSPTMCSASCWEKNIFDPRFSEYSRVHMTRFAYVCKFCIYAKFAYVRKSGHVYAFTHVCKICTYAKVGKFAPASDQVQISFCVYAKFAYMQIWSCEQKAKFAHVSIYLVVLNNC